MSLAGLKKQFNKANQYVSEKIGGAKGTELDDDFVEMERKTDVMGSGIEEIISRTHEYLQPNPASRAKMMAMTSIHKLRGTSKNVLYPQPENNLGEAFSKYGSDIGIETILGQCLSDAGGAYSTMADVKFAMEDSIKQNFLEPLGHLQNKDIKEVMHHRKKLNGRRLDYDCKRRKKEKGSHITEDELMMAEEKFDESKTLAETAMHNLLENDVEQIAQVQALVQAQLEFHTQNVTILQDLQKTLEQKRSETSSRPRNDYVPTKRTTKRSTSPVHSYDDSDSGSYSFNHTNPTVNNVHSSKPTAFDRSKPCCEAVYDFDPENDGELGFKEGDIIQLTQQVDENWYMGELNGRAGHFPINYVTVLVDFQ